MIKGVNLTRFALRGAVRRTGSAAERRKIKKKMNKRMHNNATEVGVKGKWRTGLERAEEHEVRSEAEMKRRQSRKEGRRGRGGWGCGGGSCEHGVPPFFKFLLLLKKQQPQKTGN